MSSLKIDHPLADELHAAVNSGAGGEWNSRRDALVSGPVYARMRAEVACHWAFGQPTSMRGARGVPQCRVSARRRRLAHRDLFVVAHSLAQRNPETLLLTTGYCQPLSCTSSRSVSRAF